MKCLLLVNPSVGSVAENPLVDGDARDVIRTHAFDERSVQRLVVPFVVFADKDSHELGLSLTSKGWRRRLWGPFLGHFGGLNNGGILDFNQSSPHHLVKLWQEFFNLLRRFDEFDFDRKILRQPLNMHCVHMVVSAESCDAANYIRTRDTAIEQKVEDRRINGLPVVLMVFPNVT